MDHGEHQQALRVDQDVALLALDFLPSVVAVSVRNTFSALLKVDRLCVARRRSCLLVAGAENVHDPFDDLAHINCTLVAARLAGGMSGVASACSASVRSLG